MTPHAYIAPQFPGRYEPRGCRYGEHDAGGWRRCDRPEEDPIHAHE